MSRKNLRNITLALFAIATFCFAYIVYTSKMISYLSADPKACINCHVMNTQYATWQHSAHRERATCVECHLPTDNVFEKYIAKSIDGWNHSVAFTTHQHKSSLKISDYGARRVQKNCISCHKSVTSQIISNAENHHSSKKLGDRKCWECHKSVPHGKVRGMTTAPYNLGVKEQTK
ncbi:MAG: cytochrome c nitrite reductase small subunit [Flavobacteriaceae bacterium]|nr:cytochrome c nitrite reductase small subunit [Flavobacteriaceae bacterium]